MVALLAIIAASLVGALIFTALIFRALEAERRSSRAYRRESLDVQADRLAVEDLTELRLRKRSLR